MKISLISVDSKIPNLALMKLSTWHKRRGDTVDVFDPLFSSPDRAYASKVFAFSPDYQYFPSCEVVRGGTGYDIHSSLPEEIERSRPDYDLFGCEYAMGFTSRGCIRRCPFCVVPEKEGVARPSGDIYDFWDGQPQIKLLDNNLTALPEHFERIIGQLAKERIQVDFSQGLDIRLIDQAKAALLKKVRLWKRIHFAFDDVALEQQVRDGIHILLKAGICHDYITFYVLIGYNSTPEQDLYRVQLLHSLGVNPFVMPFEKQDRYQKRFARWVNHKAVFKTVTWDDYRDAV